MYDLIIDDLLKVLYHIRLPRINLPFTRTLVCYGESGETLLAKIKEWFLQNMLIMNEEKNKNFIQIRPKFRNPLQ